MNQTAQMLAHDVRKPFTSLRVALDSLTGSAESEKMKSKIFELTEEVNQSIAMVDGMLEDILEVSSKAKMMPVSDSLGPQILKAFKSISLMGEKKTIQLRFNFNHSFEAMIVSDSLLQ